jgi:two-component system phosphate regulon sensor histidine kinase PhoR
MTWLLFTIVLLSIICAALAWRYLTLRRDIRMMTDQVRRGDILAESASELGEFASTLNARLASLDRQLSSLNIEHAKLSSILDQLTDGVIITDADGLIQFANPAAQRLFETPGALGRSVTEVLRNHQLVDAWRRCQQTGEMQSESVELPARRQFLQVIVIPDTHASGSLLLVQDLTRVRKLETVRRDFISNISHELRTPLASLKALTETLQNGAIADPDAGPRFLGRISTEVDALTQMAQELLDLSRIESGQVELTFMPVSPEQLLLTAMDRMKMQSERAGLKLSVVCDDNLPNIRADKMRLEQVFVNLIHNAVKFTKPGGEIVLGAQSNLGVVQFMVRDTGIGIPAESLSRIFERFYRADRSRTGSGTGLGLSISKHIVEVHGGKIWADSREGQGSVFYFEIPVL